MGERPFPRFGLLGICMVVGVTWLWVTSGCATDSGRRFRDDGGVNDNGDGGVKPDGGLCGNGEIDPGEECDDGNMFDGDGCSSSCLMEPCDDQTCPQGCCDGQGICVDGTQDEFCGTGGVNCEDCIAAGELCEAQVCVDLGECNPGETRECGNCGTRTCNFGGNWGSCDGQGECPAGYVDMFGSCGNCGSMQRVCGSDCTWGTVECVNEGVCAPGAVETGGACGTCGHDERVCDTATCTWGSWSCVEVQDCLPGETEQGGACGNCGTEERLCGSDCTFGNWYCTGEGVCAPGTTTSQGCGPCQAKTCTNNCTWGACQTAQEVCNGQDDDCDTVCDNGFQCCQGLTEPCNTSCGSIGTHTCSGSCTWGTCNEPAETCNGIDDDCDGQTDEGDRAEVLSTTFTVLSSFVSACNGTTEWWGVNCNQAIHDYCQSLGCPQSGFGPVERNGDNLNVTCVAGVSVRNVGFGTLAVHHQDCLSSDPLSGPCYAAIKRYCQDQGFVAGFGPVIVSGTSATVVCVTQGTYVNTTYTTMATYIPACDGTNVRIGSPCNAAIKRHCRSLGHESGFGPVENVGDDLVAVCLSP